MSITDKFTKRITIISERNDFKIKNWAFRLFERLDTVDWEYSKIIIIDRNRKFLLKLWKAIFEKLNVKLLYFISYHSQTNDANERTNQIVETTFRYLIHDFDDVSIWFQILLRFQVLANNAVSTFTEKTLNEIVYDFTFNKFLNPLFDIANLNHLSIRIEIKDVIFWANMNISITTTDVKRLSFKENDWALIKLHKKYNISSTLNITKKLTQQYVESNKIIQRIDRLTYKLNILNDWKINSMFPIAQFKSTFSFEFDLYDRSRSTNSFTVIINNDIEKLKFYKIDRLLNKIIIKREREQSMKYLVRWENYDSEWNRLYNVKNLENLDELIKEYEQMIKSVKWWLIKKYEQMIKLVKWKHLTSFLSVKKTVTILLLSILFHVYINMILLLSVY